MDSTVYIVHDNNNRYNFAGAEEFGTLARILTGPLHKIDIAMAAQAIENVLKVATDKDWLLLVGNPVLIGLAMAAFIRKTGTARCLVWDRHRLCYTPVEGELRHWQTTERR